MKKNIFVLMLTFILGSSQMSSQSFNNSILSDGDFGHFSIEQTESNSGYILAGTEYDNIGGVSIKLIKIDNNGSVLSSKTLDIEGFENGRCLKMNRRGSNGNFLIMGGAVELNSNLEKGFVIEFDENLNVNNRFFMGIGETSETIILDAEYVDNMNGVDEGYFISGFRYSATGVLTERTNKVSFYGLFTDNFSNQQYLHELSTPSTPSTPSLISRDLDLINNISIIEGDADVVVLSGTKADNLGYPKMLLLKVDLLTGNILWELDKHLEINAIEESVSGVAYDGLTDILHVVFNTEHTSGGGMVIFAIEDFNTNLPIVGNCEVVTDINFPRDNRIWGGKVMLNEVDHGNLVVQYFRPIDFDETSYVFPTALVTSGILSLSYTGYNPDPYNFNSMTESDTHGFGWSSAFHFFNNTRGLYNNGQFQLNRVGVLPPNNSFNSFCYSNKPEENYVMSHYRTDFQKIDLNLVEINIANFQTGDNCLSSQAINLDRTFPLNSNLSPVSTSNRLGSVSFPNGYIDEFDCVDYSECELLNSNSAHYIRFPVGNYRKKSFIQSSEMMDELKIYPSPALESIYLENIKMEEVTKITILDMNGRRMEVKLTLENKLDIAHLSSGLYIIEINKMDGSVLQEKFSKMK